jgi:hypothetical protein
MGRRLGYAIYDFHSKTIMDHSCLDKEVIPTLLTGWIMDDYEATVKQLNRATLNLPPKELYNLELQCTLKYEPNLAGEGFETPYCIEIYPTYGFLESNLEAVSTKEDPTAVQVLDLSYVVTHNHIPEHVLLNFDTYAEMINECGEKCINQSGYANIPLAEVVSNHLNEPIELELTVPNSTRKPLKGKLTIVIERSSLPAVIPKEISRMEKERQNMINQYIQLNMTFYKRHPPTNPSIANVTAFHYKTRVGTLPGSTFDVFHLPPSQVDYYHNIMLIAYRRRLRTDRNQLFFTASDEELLQQLLNESNRFFLLVTLDMLAIFVNYCAYITDEVDCNTVRKKHNNVNIELIESFDDIRTRYCGDCEDFALEVLKHVMEIKYHKHTLRTPLMNRLREVLSSFIFVSGLAGVTNKSITSKNKSSIHLGGHECAYAIPNYIFFEALRRREPSNPLFGLYTLEEQLQGANDQEIIYVIEGTGNLFPEPRTKDRWWRSIDDDLKSYALAQSFLEVYIDAFFYDPNQENNFYKMIISLFTPDFFFKTGIPMFEFLLCNEENRGVMFTELLNLKDNPNIQIRAAPLIPPEIFDLCMSVHHNDMPPVKLIIPTITEEMKSIARRLNVPSPSSSSSSSKQKVYSFQIRFEDMTEERINALLRISSEKLQMNLSCDIEAVHLGQFGKIVGGYNISFF